MSAPPANPLRVLLLLLLGLPPPYEFGNWESSEEAGDSRCVARWRRDSAVA